MTTASPADADVGTKRLITKPPQLRIIPPLNFCPVERFLYRSGQPAGLNHSFLAELNLKTILWLATEDPLDQFLTFAENNDINVYFVSLDDDEYDYSNNPWDGLSETAIRKALQVIANKESYPLLVCCGMGRHRTGTVIGCLRRLQGWNLASVSEEYRRFVGDKGGRIMVELLIEAFDVSSIKVDPAQAPEFLLR
ncbi:hypothetical protein BABINDRAFT_170635 [Babjeviella inositovora NRRL Y-12698]|uniref:Putative tyrosine-protein phosphatase OCA1 n=1 Tax=Babjeviella inositovora NRRL Y-12698 TaxID=984486 RepID=A0A1E3QWP3_9ASCO|nr:uncharacterized protein BABINDRAFT_170635 [Babjeviella inositovora NRRL Y-12698]ODQ82103.1 hypothetical protein BABINDRAFT_170635 [Babjeviella inositovora NRRL Y-12698]